MGVCDDAFFNSTAEWQVEGSNGAACAHARTGSKGAGLQDWSSVYLVVEERHRRAPFERESAIDSPALANYERADHARPLLMRRRQHITVERRQSQFLDPRCMPQEVPLSDSSRGCVRTPARGGLRPVRQVVSPIATSRVAFQGHSEVVSPYSDRH